MPEGKSCVAERELYPQRTVSVSKQMPIAEWRFSQRFTTEARRALSMGRMGQIGRMWTDVRDLPARMKPDLQKEIRIANKIAG